MKRELTREEKKIKTFMEDFKKLRNPLGEHIMIGLFIFLNALLSFLPAQETLKEAGGMVFSMGIMIFGINLGNWAIHSCRTYNDGKTTYKVKDTLKYRPVDFEVFRKVKTEMLVQYFTKQLPLYLVLQIFGSLLLTGTLSWVNFVYVLILFYLLPLGINLLSVYFDE